MISQTVNSYWYFMPLAIIAFAAVVFLCNNYLDNGCSNGAFSLPYKKDKYGELISQDENYSPRREIIQGIFIYFK